MAEEENSSLSYSLFINKLQILSLSLGEQQQQQTNISRNKRRIHSRASRRYARTTTWIRIKTFGAMERRLYKERRSDVTRTRPSHCWSAKRASKRRIEGTGIRRRSITREEWRLHPKRRRRIRIEWYDCWRAREMARMLGWRGFWNVWRRFDCPTRMQNKYGCNTLI